MDSVRKELRSKIMARIKSKGNKSTEIKFRMVLVRAGIAGWQIQPKGLLGNPDIVFPELKLALFIDGCFWHGCPKCGHVPKSNKMYWKSKLDHNIKRDKKQRARLRKTGWFVYRIWEHELKNPDKVMRKTENIIKSVHQF